MVEVHCPSQFVLLWFLLMIELSIEIRNVLNQSNDEIRDPLREASLG